MKTVKLTIWLAVLVVFSFSGALFGAIPSRAARKEYYLAQEEYFRNYRADKGDKWDEFRAAWRGDRFSKTSKENLCFWLEESDQVFAKASASVEDKQAKAIIVSCAKLRKAAIVFVVCYDGGSGRPAYSLVEIVHEGYFFPYERSWYTDILARAITVRAFDDFQTAYADLHKLLARSSEKVKYGAGLAIIQARGKDYKAKYWEVCARTFKECSDYDCFFGEHFCLTDLKERKETTQTVSKWRECLINFGAPRKGEAGETFRQPIGRLFNPPRHELEEMVTKDDLAEIWKRSAIELKKLVILDPAEDNFEYWQLASGSDEPPLLVKFHKTPSSFFPARVTVTIGVHYGGPKPERISSVQYEESKKEQGAWLSEHPGSAFVLKQRNGEDFEREVEQNLALNISGRKAAVEKYLREKELKQQLK